MWGFWSLIKLCSVICKPYNRICMHLWIQRIVVVRANVRVIQWNTAVSDSGTIVITVSRIKYFFPSTLMIPFFNVLITFDTTPMAINAKIYLYLIKQFPGSCRAVLHRWKLHSSILNESVPSVFQGDGALSG